MLESGQVFVIIVVALVTGAVTLSAFAQAWASTRKRSLRTDGDPRLEAIEARLARMENAIESVAVEMERIAEGQRFTARLLSERAPSASQPAPSRPAQASDQRVVTPR